MGRAEALAAARGGREFWSGLVVGVLLVMMFLFGALYRLQSTGLTVPVDARDLANQIDAEVQAELRQEMPAALAEMKVTLPAIVARRAAEKLREGKVDLGPVTVDLPPALVQEVQGRLTAILAEAVSGFVDQVSVDQVAQRLGAEAQALVRERLVASMAEQRFPLRPLPWLTIPITVKVTNL